MRVRILRSAGQDLLDGYRFYESLQTGIGERFLASVFADIDALAVTAGVHPTHFGGFHRSLAKRFPFAIYYRVVADTTVVYAVLDCRRSPAWVRATLERPQPF